MIFSSYRILVLKKHRLQKSRKSFIFNSNQVRALCALASASHLFIENFSRINSKLQSISDSQADQFKMKFTRGIFFLSLVVIVIASFHGTEAELQQVIRQKVKDVIPTCPEGRIYSPSKRKCVIQEKVMPA
jgi:hypothetical protein